MRIGYLVPEFPGQTHAFFWREIQELERLGVTVDLVSTRRPTAGQAPHQWAEAAAARTTYLYPLGFAGACVSSWQALKSGPAAWRRCATNSACRPFRAAVLALLGARLSQLGEQRNWTHLHVHSCADAATIALYAHCFSGLSYSLTLHGDLRGYGDNQANKWRNAAFAIAVCNDLRRQVTQEIGDQLPARVLVAPMGVDVKVWRRSAAYEPYEGHGPLRVFSCGRLHPGKGHEDVIRAIAELRHRGLDVQLTIAGSEPSEGNYGATLEAAARVCGVSELVRFAGSLGEELVREELEHAHLFVLASHQEALGVATMEAMAMEVPVIVTRVGGVPELVEDGREGLLVAPRDPTGLAAAINACVATPQRCRSMGQAGRVKVESQFHSGLSARAIVDGIAATQADRLRQASPTTIEAIAR